MQARIDDGGNAVPPTATFESRSVDVATVSGDTKKTSVDDKTVPVTSKTEFGKVELLRGIPEDKLYGIKPARLDSSRKMVAALSKVTWPACGIIKIGWVAADLPLCKGLEEEEEERLRILGLASRLFHDHLRETPKWTYSVLTLAKNQHLKELLVQGGAGGSAYWTWSKIGFLPSRIGHSRKFNANQKIVDFHSRTLASLFPGDEECYGVLAHNFSNEPYDIKEHRAALKEMGLVPSPPADSLSSEEETDPETEGDEDPPPGSPLWAISGAEQHSLGSNTTQLRSSIKYAVRTHGKRENQTHTC